MMPKAYSLDLRWRVVYIHLAQGWSNANIGSLLSLSEKTVSRYLTRFYQTGEVEPTLHKNGPSKILSNHEQLLLLKNIIKSPGIYLHELQHVMEEALGVAVSVATICRTLKSMGCTRQVIHHIAIQRSDEIRARYMAEISMYDPSMFVWLDESGCDRRNSMRKYGYGIRGIPPVDHRLLIRGTRYSAIPIMSVGGIHDVYLAEGNVNGCRFAHFINEYLIPVLLPYNGINPLSIVIMDNASIHHVDTNIDLIESFGSKIIFLPPYSPDLNPLEPVFNKVKIIMKENDKIFQACSAPRALLATAFGMVTPQDCYEFSKHCGYIQ